MPFMHIQGRVDVRTYKELCENNGHNPEEKKCIFIFPGNESHHVLGTTLFSIKSGGGLAAASAAIGTAGYPTLSLPTTSMEQWSISVRQQQIVHGAVADLYKALGAGYQLMLPVREHQDATYFDHPLHPAEMQVEPSFWGGIQAAANKPLANYYIKELNALSLFMSLSPAQRDKQLQADKTNPFYQVYVQGQNMAIDDPWLVPKMAVKKTSEYKGNQAEECDRNTSVNEPLLVPKVTTKKASGYKESQVLGTTKMSKPEANAKPYIAARTRASYEKYYEKNQDALTNARNLLNNYTENNSMLMRFFSGHWNRHHVVAVNKLVEQIDKKQITDIVDLIKQLKEIKLVNPNGSLARRICCIEEINPVKPNSDEPSTPSLTL